MKLTGYERLKRGSKQQPGYIKKSYELPEYPGRVKANNEINEEKEKQKELDRLERAKEYEGLIKMSFPDVVSHIEKKEV